MQSSITPIALVTLLTVLAGATDAVAKTTDPPSRRWIAVTTSTECPLPSITASPKAGLKTQSGPLPVSESWTVTPAFPRIGRVVSKAVPLPPSLRRFCIYTRKTPSASPPSFTAEAQRAITRIDPDYDVLLPQAPPPSSNHEVPGHTDIPQTPNDNSAPDVTTPQELAEKAYKASMALFAETAGVTGIPSNQAIYVSPHGPHAYLAIVDTASTEDGAGGYDKARFARHGLAMAAIAGKVRCPSGDAKCLAHTHLEQAFPYTGLKRAVKDSSLQLGGTASLAQAIWQTLDDWRTARRTSSEHASLVLNLSLGWDPKRYGTIPDELVANHLDLLDEVAGAGARAKVPVPVQVIHAAIVYASCLDVLTLAAAGNTQVDSCDAEGPLNPAQWERLAAPTWRQCEAMFAAAWLEPQRSGLIPGFSGPRSLVYAVGGLSVGDTIISGDIRVGPNVLSMGRPGSVPPRLVSASHAIAQWKNQWTGAWSGTSVAAAAYAGLAAAVWTQRPELTSHELVAKIDASGRSGGKADFPKPGQTTRLINGHAAYNAACGLSAPGQRSCDPSPYVPSDDIRRATLVNEYRDTVMSSLGLQKWAPNSTALTTNNVELNCGRQRTHYYPANKSSFPSVEYQLPWVRPQPETPICSVCPIKGNKLYISLNPTALGSYLPANGPITLVDTTLQFGTASINLGDLLIDPRGAEVNLSNYRIGVYPLTDVFNLFRTDEGTLTVTVKGADGKPATVTSTVQVLH